MVDTNPVPLTSTPADTPRLMRWASIASMSVATVLIAFDEWLQWRIARLAGADLPFTVMLPQLLISVCAFPLSAWAVSRIDSWRLGR